MDNSDKSQTQSHLSDGDGCRSPDLPASSYAWVEDPAKKTTWHLPYKDAAGKVKCGCVRAAIAAIGGARTGRPMTGVPDSAISKLRAAAKTCNIETELALDAVVSKYHSDKHPAAFSVPNKDVSYINDLVTGDVVFKNVTLLAEGTWTDAYSKKTIHYSAAELSKMKIEKRTIKMAHDIYNQLPLTNEIGVIENERYVTDPTARWVSDVRIFPTQNGNDVVTLLKRKQITDISSEVFHNPVRNKAGVLNSTNILFMGAATVRQGACSACTFNEGDQNMEENNQDKEKDKASEVAALEAKLAEVKRIKEQALRIQELETQIAEMEKEPVMHSHVSGKGAGRHEAAELDSGTWEAFTIKDFGD